MNFSTVIVLAIVVSAAAGAVYSIYKSKKAGKSCSCGGSCGACPSAGMCHSSQK